MASNARAISAPNPIDQHVGVRIRMRRLHLDWSQKRLAIQLGMTFQQVQKYEQGTNRVAASTLYGMARALQVPIAYFFDGFAETSPDTDGETPVPAAMRELMTTREGIELADRFARLHSTAVRRQVVLLVQALVEEDPQSA